MKEKLEVSLDIVVEFFRDYAINYWGIEEAKDASTQEILQETLSPNMNPGFVSRFLKAHVLGEVICSKFDKYDLKLGKYHKIDITDEETLKLYQEFVGLFNPGVVYSSFNAYSENGSNLVVLKRQTLTDEEKRELIQRGEEWLNVFYPIEKEINEFLGWRFSNNIESLIAKTNPEIPRNFIYQGKVLRFDDDNDPLDLVCQIGGMIVDGFEGHAFSYKGELPLINADSKEKFGYLLGKDVKFHYLNFVRDMCGSPYGELISAPGTEN